MRKKLEVLDEILIKISCHLNLYISKIFRRSLEQSKLQLIRTQMDQVEYLLYACDLQLLKQRSVHVTMLKSVENGMEDREKLIKEQLRQIAVLEMQKGREEDEMLDQTLKAIEIVNISDMSSEREGLQDRVDTLSAKKAELDKQEDDLIREKIRRAQKSGARQATIREKNEPKAPTPHTPPN